MSVSARLLPPVVKSAEDTREYRSIELPNGLQCLIVVDGKQADKPSNAKGGSSSPCAAALSVNVGYFSDPTTVLGLAHFLEHMLFMGTEKYPDENEWEAWLTERGGSSNASTDCEFTVFEFDVQPAYLREALERFSTFFICPLMKAGAVKREIRAVNSEFKDSVQSDFHRRLEVVARTAKEGHPCNKFGWGNILSLETLPQKSGTDVRAELLKFHKRYYFAEMMRLIVYDSARSLDQVQHDIEEYFTLIPNRASREKEIGPIPPSISPERPLYHPEFRLLSRQPDTSFISPVAPQFGFAGCPFGKEAFGHYFYIVPVRDTHSIELTWSLPNLGPYYREKPTEYIDNLLGHEGNGGLLAALKARGWASALYAGVPPAGMGRSSATWLFSVSITMTESGMEHRDEVLELVWAYLKMIREVGPKQRLWDELRSIADMSFRFLERNDPVDFVEEIAVYAHAFPPSDIIAGNFIFYKFDEALIQEVLNLLVPQTVRIDLVDKRFGPAVGSAAVASSESKLAASDNPSEIEDAMKKETELMRAQGYEVDPWFGTVFKREKINDTVLSKWLNAAQDLKSPDGQPLFYLPPPNEFIATDFSLKGPRGVPEPPIPANCLPPAGFLAKVTSSINALERGSKPSAAAAKAAADDKRAKKRKASETKEDIAALRRKNYQLVANTELKYLTPTKLIDTPYAQVWYKLDPTFNTPRASVFFQFYSPVSYSSPALAAQCALFVNCLEDSLTEYSYPASLAELSYSITTCREGVEVKVGGFNDKLFLLIDRIFQRMKSLQITPPQFTYIKEKLIKKWKHQHFAPYKHATYLRLLFLQKDKFSSDVMLQAAEQVTLEDIHSFRDQWCKTMFLECLVHGNVTEQETHTLIQNVISTLKWSPLPAEQRLPKQVINLPLGQSVFCCVPTKNPKETNSAVHVYLEVGPSASPAVPALATVGPLPSSAAYDGSFIYSAVMLQLMERIIQEPFFDQLRTKEQLGYNVNCCYRLTDGVAGFSFMVQSAQHKPPHLEERVEAFLLKFKQQLHTMTPKQFYRHVEGLITEKLYNYNNLQEESDDLWEEICEHTGNFFRIFQEVHSLLLITKEQLVEFFDTYFLPIEFHASHRHHHHHHHRSIHAAPSAANEKGQPAKAGNKQHHKHHKHHHHGPKAAQPTTSHVPVNDVLLCGCEVIQAAQQASAADQQTQPVAAADPNGVAPMDEPGCATAAAKPAQAAVSKAEDVHVSDFAPLPANPIRRKMTVHVFGSPGDGSGSGDMDVDEHADDDEDSSAKGRGKAEEEEEEEDEDGSDDEDEEDESEEDEDDEEDEDEEEDDDGSGSDDDESGSEEEDEDEESEEEDPKSKGKAKGKSATESKETPSEKPTQTTVQQLSALFSHIHPINNASAAAPAAPSRVVFNSVDEMMQFKQGATFYPPLT